MADRFKEYKAYLPPKWAGFDDLPAGGALRKKMSFASNMATVMGQPGGGGAGGKRSVSAPISSGDGSSDDDSSDSGGHGHHMGGGVKKKKKQYVVNGRRLRGSEAWAHEMSLYCEEQEQKKVAKRRTEELEEDLKKKQKKSIAMKAKALEAPLLEGGKKMPSSYHALQTTHPTEVAKYSHLLRAAAVIDQQERRDRCETFLDEKQGKIDAKVNNHLSHIDKRNVELSKDRRDNTRILHHRNEEMQMTAEHHRVEKQQKDDNLRQERHQAALKRERDQQRRQAEAEEVARKKREEAATLKQKRVNAATKRMSEKQNDFESKMRSQADKALEQLAEMEMRRRAVIQSDPIGQAQARAEKVQNEKREAQLNMIESDERKRNERLKLKELRDKEDFKDMVARHRHAEQSNEARNTSAFSSRMGDIKKEMKHHHRETYRYPTPEEKTKERLAHAFDLQEKLAQEKQLKQDNLERDMKEREERVNHAQSLARSSAHGVYVKDEEKRAITRSKAAEIEANFAEATEADVAKRIEHSNDVLRRLEKERKQRVERESGEKAERIRDALDLVNVKKTRDAIRAMKKKEKEAAARKAIREAKQREEVLEKQRQDEATRQRMHRQIDQARRDREDKNQSSLDAFNERCDQAQAARDDSQHSRSMQLHDDFEKRLGKARTAANDKEDKFLRMKEEQRLQDEAYQKRRAEEEKEARDIRRMKANDREEKTENAFQHRTDNRNQWMDRTMSKLSDAYSRGGMSPAHPITESFGGWKQPSMNPPRPRTMSPTY